MRFLFGPALSAWILLVKRIRPLDRRARRQFGSAQGRLRPTRNRGVIQQRLFMRRVRVFAKALALYSSQFRSTLTCRRRIDLGMSGKTFCVSSGIAVVACTSCNSASNDFFSSGNCMVRLVRLRFRRRIRLIHARFVQRRLSINRFHFERRVGSLLGRQSQVAGAKSRLIKIRAEQQMNHERQHQPQKEPVALTGRI